MEGEKRRGRKRKKERENVYLVNRPDGKRQRLSQKSVVPPSPAAVERRDGVRERREEVGEVARGSLAREGERKRRRRHRGRGRG